LLKSVAYYFLYFLVNSFDVVSVSYTTRLESLIIGLFVVCYLTYLNESLMTYKFELKTHIIVFETVINDSFGKQCYRCVYFERVIYGSV
jgi:hypothetical protein